MITPSYKDAERCFSLRCKSKSGGGLNPDEQEFCNKILKKYPEWYSSINDDVIEATLPFGAVRSKKGASNVGG